MLLALLWLAAAANSDDSAVDLARETFRVEAHDYRYIDAKIAHWPATLICAAQVMSGSPVKLEVLSRSELIQFVHNRAYHYVLALPDRSQLAFRQALPEQGDFEILFINNADRPSDVRVQAQVQFAPEPDVAKYLSPRERLIVILTSISLFLGILVVSAWYLVAAMRKSRTIPDHLK